jgi:hypothetical protein
MCPSGGSGYKLNGIDKLSFVQVLQTLGDGCIAFWPNIEVTGSIISDFSKNGLDGNTPNNIEQWDHLPLRKNIVNTYRTNNGLISIPNEYIRITDNDILTFGNGAVDSPFSIGVWAFGDTWTDIVLFKKPLEYELVPGGWFILYDGANLIGRLFPSPSVNNWHLFIGTYDGSSAVGGIKVYVDGIRVDNADISVGLYTAMSNNATDVDLTRVDNIPSDLRSWGHFITGKELSEFDIWNLYMIGKAVMNL